MAGSAYLELEKKAEETGLSKPSLSDAIVLAVARKNDGKVLTGDAHFEGLPDTVWMGT